MLLSALTSGSLLTIVVTIVAAIFLVLVSIPVHEAAHAYAAYKLGDKSIKAQGRLTLNPLVHIDPIGAIMIVLIGFGWGRPTPVNSRDFKNPKKDMALVAFAGPLSNLLVGWLLLFIRAILVTFAPGFMTMFIGQAVSIFLVTTSQISIWLGVLNLLPIPMFDGFTILSAFLPPETEYKIMQNQGVISIVIILLLFTGILTKPVAFLADFVIAFLNYISFLPFSWF